MDDRFSEDTYVIRRKVFKLFGGAFHIYDARGRLVMYSTMKAFRLKEDIRLFTDEHMSVELLRIAALQVIDFAATYEVYDSVGTERLGSVRRKGLKSLLRDDWEILNAQGDVVGSIQEDSIGLALMRRFLTNLIPQKFTASLGDTVVCQYRQNFNPFVLKLTADFSSDQERLFDRRLGIACGILLCAIEGRQS